MMRLMRIATSGLLGLILAATSLPAAPRQQPAAEGNEDRDRQIMERFKSVLEKTPRRGTALDRVYGYHVERGSLDTLLKTYRDRVAKDPKDGTAWLLIGLLESQRGKDSEAVLALREAEKAKSDDALPSYYLGQALVLVGQPDAAAEAFERALERKPLRSDLLEIYQALGRVHQRAHRADKALAVWTRLEALFPDDLRVQEQIAAALSEEDQPAQALDRYEKLSKRVTDSYRKIQLRLESAALKVKLGKSKEALVDFEDLLGKLDPDSWLARDVRRKIEDVFLRRDDLAGLAAYYDSWINKTPDDIEAMTRLGRTLSQMGRGEDARKWLEKAVKLAPSRKELRLALIENLRQRGDVAAASTQFETLAKYSPNDPDILRDWGRMLLNDVSKPEAERKAAAAAIWRRLVREDTKDPVAVAQAADLFRQANLVDDAIAYYKKAIELAPDASQYREYLGEYYHHLKRPADALATWRETVAGSARTAKTLGRLGEVMAGFGYRNEALEPLGEAIQLDPEDLDLRLKKADVLLLLDRPKEADAELERCEKLATEQEQAEAVLIRRIKTYQAENRLAQVIKDLRASLTAAAKPDVKGWTRLARYYEADGKPAEAARAAVEATKADPRSVPAWTVLARLQEATGNLLAAADASRTLATLDRRSRTDYLTNIAKLEARLGRREQALKAGRELLAAAPGNPDHDQFFADLCFGLNEPDEALDALRRSARANPSEPKIMITLAENLARLFRTDEAIELYWRAFDKTNELEGKLGIIAKLTDQYSQKNQFDRLLARIERELRDQDRVREKSLCLAQAHQSSGDFSSARQELEKLLTVYPKDIVLLRQLSTLAENAGDPVNAAGFQKRLNDLSPSEEGNSRLAQLYVRAGNFDEASALWLRAGDNDKDPARAIASIDSLIATGKSEVVSRVIDSRLRQDPKNWELLYRKAVTSIDTGQTDAADAAFRAILDLRLDDDTLSAAAIKASQKPGGSPAGLPSRSPNSALSYPHIQLRLNAASTARSLISLDSRQSRAVAGNQALTPSDYGQARISALAWQVFRGKAAGTQESFVAKLTKQLQDNPNDPRLLWDHFYTQVMDRNPNLNDLVSVLSERLPDDPSAQLLYLMYSPNRLSGNRNRQSYSFYFNPANSSTDGGTENSTEAQKALLDRALRALQTIQASKPSWPTFSYVPWLLPALREANRTSDYQKLAADLINAATEPGVILQLAEVFAQAKDEPNLKKLAEAYHKISQTNRINTYNNFYTPESQVALRRMGIVAESNDFRRVLQVLDEARALRRETRVSEKRFGSPVTRSQSAREQYNIVVWTSATTASSVNVDTPFSLDWVTLGDIQILRSALAIARSQSSVDQLIKRFSDTSKARTNDERLDDQIALVLIYWWENEQENALAALKQAVALAPKNVSLLLALGDFHARLGELTEALAVIDQVDAIDQDVMKRRESAALRLAVRIGDANRARQASERLFGLRLDSATQLELSSQMSQLGLYDMADAVLNRAQRDAGNRVASLVSLMYQFQNQGRTEQAVEAAYQILKLTPGSVSSQAGAMRSMPVQSMAFTSSGALNVQFSSPVSSANDANANYRRQALFTLSRAGRLRDLIKRAEDQLAAAPKNEALIRTLIEYYTVDNRNDQIQKLQASLININPNNPRARLDAALRTVSTGSVDQGIKEIETAIKAEPTLLNEYSNQLNSLFASNHREDQYYQLIETADTSKIQNGWVLAQAAQLMVINPRFRERGLKLYGKVLKSYPNERWNHIYQLMNTDYALQIPELYTAARDYLFSSEAVYNTAWAWSDTLVGNRPTGKPLYFVTAVVDAAMANGKGDEFSSLLDTEAKKRKDWQGVLVFQSVLAVRQKRNDVASKLVDQMLSQKKTPIPVVVRTMLGDEFEAAGLTALAQRMSADVVEDQLKAIASGKFDVNQAFATINQLRAAGKKQEVGKILDQLASTQLSKNDETDQARLMFVQAVLSPTAQAYLNDNRTLDAIRVWRRCRSILSQSSSDDRNKNSWVESINRSLMSTVETCSPALRPQALEILLDTDANTSSEMGVMVYDSQLALSRIDSRLTQLITRMSDSAAMTKSLRDVVDKAATRSPKNLDLLILSTWMASLGEGDPKSFAAGTKRLRQWAEANPLPSTAKRPGTDAERAPFALQLGLWLVAREGLASSETRSDAEFLAQRSLDATMPLPNPSWRRAILREWGDLAITNGDKTRGETLWAELLDSIQGATRRAGGNDQKAEAPKGAFQPSGRKAIHPSIANRSGRPAASLVKRQISKPKMATPQNLGPSTSNPESSMTPPKTTKAKFDQSLALALMAASKGLNELSLKATRDAFASGPPLEANAASEGMISAGLSTPFTLTRTIRSGVSSQPLSMSGSWTSTATWQEIPTPPVTPTIGSQLTALEREWLAHGIAKVKVYEIIRDIVLPPARPYEVYLFADSAQANGQPTPFGSSGQPTAASDQQAGIGSQLVRLAKDTNALDDLNKRLRERLSKPAAELNALVLLSEVARASNDPAATNDLLARFSERLKANTLQNTIALAIRIATPAMENDATSDEAAKLLDLCLKNVQRVPGSLNFNRLGLTLARYEFRRKRPEQARARLEAFLDAEERIARRSGTNALPLTRTASIEEAASELASYGMQLDALVLMGRVADLPDAPDLVTNPRLMTPIFRKLTSLPAEERYIKLREWILPTKDRRLVRMLADFSGSITPPPEFEPLFKEIGVARSIPAGPIPDLITTSWQLVSTAKELGKLDELAEEVKNLAQDRVENADRLHLLIEWTRGKGAETASRYEEFVKERMPVADASNMISSRGRILPVVVADLEIAALAIAAKSTSESAEKLLNRWVQLNRGKGQCGTILALVEAQRLASKIAGATMPPEPGLPAWIVDPSPTMIPSMGSGSTWVAAEGYVSRTVGRVYDFLLFRYPLTGTFDIEADVRFSESTTALLNFGSINDDPFRQAPTTAHTSANMAPEQQSSGWRVARPNVFNRVLIKVEPKSARLYVNGHLYRTYTGSQEGDPWLRLSVRGNDSADWRNLRIRGNPTIPSSIDLIKSLSSFNSAARTAASIAATTNAPPVRAAMAPGVSPQPAKSETLTMIAPGWSIVDGELTGARLNATTATDSRVSLRHPLIDKDVVSYQFFYVPGQTEAHPVIGQVAFLLAPEGVRLRWIATPMQDFTFKPDHSVAPPGGSSPVPLKANAWNDAEVSVVGDDVRLKINGQDVITYRLQENQSRSLGVMHNPGRTNARIRQASLRGDWPKELSPELKRDLLATPSGRDPKVSAVADVLLSEALRAENAETLMESIREQSPKDRYDALVKFVLPNSEHGSIRAQGFSSVDQMIVAPAAALVEAAHETNQLSSLAKRVGALKPIEEVDLRAQQALLVMIHARLGEDQTARTFLDALVKRLSAGIPRADSRGLAPPRYGLWPELLAARAGGSRPELKQQSLALLDKVLEPWSMWDPNANEFVIHAARTRAQIQYPNLVETPLKWFVPLNRSTTARQGLGIPPAGWSLEGDTLRHIPGNTTDQLAFRVPIVGDFEATAELSTGSLLEETRMTYGGVWIGPKPDRTSVTVTTPENGTSSAGSSLPKDIGKTYTYKLVVKKSRLIASVNGTVIGDHTLPSDPYPFLILEAPGVSRGTVRKFSITGNPRVVTHWEPLKNLITVPWTNFFRTDAGRGPQPSWNVVGEELQSLAQSPSSGLEFNDEDSYTRQQALLRRRPPTIQMRTMLNSSTVGWDPAQPPSMAQAGVRVGYTMENLLRLNLPLQDGMRIEYEFFQDPASAGVSPALGATSFLFSEKGLATHTVSNAPFIRPSIDPDNRRPDPTALGQAGGLKLKPGAWNRVSVAMSGGKVLVQLNDQTVVDRPLAAEEERQFGLFQYANEGISRVRQVKVSGGWPLVLPASEDWLAKAK